MFVELIKSAAAQTDHQRVFWVGMKNRAGSNPVSVRNDQMGDILKIDGGFAVESAAPDAAHFHNRVPTFDRDVIVRGFERKRTYVRGS